MTNNQDKEKKKNKVLQVKSTKITGNEASLWRRSSSKCFGLRRRKRTFSSCEGSHESSWRMSLRAKRQEIKVKLLRAQGECLGTNSRRRTRQAAKSHGEQQICTDPWMSEWGNPHEVNARVPPHKYIVCRGKTE